MIALALKTVPAYPLGRPVDGRERFSMTPDQARVYRWLVANRPHDEAFRVNCRKLAAILCSSTAVIHKHVLGLEERGWLRAATRNGGWSSYAFVQPVMMFKERRHG